MQVKFSKNKHTFYYEDVKMTFRKVAEKKPGRPPKYYDSKMFEKTGSVLSDYKDLRRVK